MRFTKITIIKAENNLQDTNINELLQWFGGTLGLFNLRDKDKSCYRIFLTLIKDLKRTTKGMSSDYLAEETGLTRGTVIHHLNKLMESGIVYSERGQYALRVETLEELVEEIRIQLNKTLDGLKVIGKEIDEKLRLN